MRIWNWQLSFVLWLLLVNCKCSSRSLFLLSFVERKKKTPYKFSIIGNRSKLSTLIRYPIKLLNNRNSIPVDSWPELNIKSLDCCDNKKNLMHCGKLFNVQGENSIYGQRIRNNTLTRTKKKHIKLTGSVPFSLASACSVYSSNCMNHLGDDDEKKRETKCQINNRKTVGIRS